MTIGNLISLFKLKFQGKINTSIWRVGKWSVSEEHSEVACVVELTLEPKVLSTRAFIHKLVSVEGAIKSEDCVAVIGLGRPIRKVRRLGDEVWKMDTEELVCTSWVGLPSEKDDSALVRLVSIDELVHKRSHVKGDGVCHYTACYVGL